MPLSAMTEKPYFSGQFSFIYIMQSHKDMLVISRNLWEMLGKLLQVFSEENKHTQTFERDILLLHHVKS